MADTVKDKILEEAAKLFAAQGYNGTSVRDIAKNAGVNLSMISYYFGSKELLMEAILLNKKDNTAALFQKIVHQEGLTAKERIEAFLSVFVANKMRETEFNRIMMTEEILRRNAQFIDITRELKLNMIHYIQQMLSEAEKEGLVKNGYNSVNIYSTIIGTINMMIINKPFYKLYYSIEESDKTFDKKYEHIIKEHLLNIIYKTLF